MQQSSGNFVASIYKKIESRGEIDRREYLSKNRTELEKPIFDYLRAQYLPFLQEWWKTYTLPAATTANRSIVIYETRKHENLEFLIYNSTFYCPNWTLTIYCTHQNYDHICSILAHNKDRAALHIVNEKTGEYTSDRNAYISFMKSRQLWDSIPYEYVLLLEMDAYLLRHVPATLTADYYCAPWPWHPDLPGGSGLTIRAVAAMREICAQLPESADAIFDQDYWGGAGIKELKKSFNNSLFIEAGLTINPVGVHQWWTFIQPTPEYIQYYIDYLILKA
jgi:hypothetical protein